MTRTAFTNCLLLDGENPGRPDMRVVVESDRIVAVDAGAPAQPVERTIDLAGRTLMPGMVTGHYHAVYHDLGGASGDTRITDDPTTQAYRALSNSQIALRCGYTSVVGAGAHHGIDARLAEAIDSGMVKGPRFIPSTRALQASIEAVPEGAHSRWCRTAEEFERAVRADVAAGARIVKVFATGEHGATPPRDMTLDELYAVVETAHASGARVRAHVAGRDKVLECVAAGVDIIDHADGMDDSCIEAFLAAGSFVLPSLLLPLRAVEKKVNAFGFTDLKAFDYMCSVLPKAAAAGVKLVPGDDYGVWQMPHGTYSEELALYVERAGVSALDVIKWATKYGGELTGIPGLGMIAPGALADMVIVEGDPSQDITVLTRPENIRAVFKGGELAAGQLPV